MKNSNCQRKDQDFWDALLVPVVRYQRIETDAEGLPPPDRYPREGFYSPSFS